MRSISNNSRAIVIVVAIISILFIVDSSIGQVIELNKQQKESIKQEISTLSADLVKAVNQEDIEVVMQYFVNSEDLLVVKMNGSYVEYNGLEYELGEFFKRVESINYVKHDEGFRFINKNNVLYTWVGRLEFIGQKGNKVEIRDIVDTSLLTKFQDKWKVAYIHTSGSRPKIEESN